MSIAVDPTAAPAAPEFVALRDTKVVLGHWYACVTPNAMALPDFSALAAMIQAALGHARVLDAAGVRDDATPEPAASVVLPPDMDLCSMQLLDQPPLDWTDFVVTALLAEEAVAARLSAIGAAEPARRAVTDRVLGESSFVLDYVRGWWRVAITENAAAVVERLRQRLPALATWYPSPGDADLRELLDRALVDLGLSGGELLARAAEAAPWDPRRRRPVGSSAPAALRAAVTDKPI